MSQDERSVIISMRVEQAVGAKWYTFASLSYILILGGPWITLGDVDKFNHNNIQRIP